MRRAMDPQHKSGGCKNPAKMVQLASLEVSAQYPHQTWKLLQRKQSLTTPDYRSSCTALKYSYLLELPQNPLYPQSTFFIALPTTICLGLDELIFISFSSSFYFEEHCEKHILHLPPPSPPQSWFISLLLSFCVGEYYRSLGYAEQYGLSVDKQTGLQTQAL